MSRGTVLAGSFDDELKRRVQVVGGKSAPSISIAPAHSGPQIPEALERATERTQEILKVIENLDLRLGSVRSDRPRGATAELREQVAHVARAPMAESIDALTLALEAAIGRLTTIAETLEV